MALQVENPDAQSGMTKAIFDQMDTLLSPPLADAVTAAVGDDAKKAAQETLDAARAGWRKLSFAVAAGVRNHLLANLEVRGVRTTGSISATVAGTTATQNGVIFLQSNDGPGRVA